MFWLFINNYKGHAWVVVGLIVVYVASVPHLHIGTLFCLTHSPFGFGSINSAIKQTRLDLLIIICITNKMIISFDQFKIILIQYFIDTMGTRWVKLINCWCTSSCSQTLIWNTSFKTLLTNLCSITVLTVQILLKSSEVALETKNKSKIIFNYESFF